MKLNDIFTDEGAALVNQLLDDPTFENGVKLGIIATFGSLRVSGKMIDSVVKLTNKTIEVGDFFDAIGTSTVDEYAQKIMDSIEKE